MYDILSPSASKPRTIRRWVLFLCFFFCLFAPTPWAMPIAPLCVLCYMFEGFFFSPFQHFVFVSLVMLLWTYALTSIAHREMDTRNNESNTNRTTGTSTGKVKGWRWRPVSKPWPHCWVLHRAKASINNWGMKNNKNRHTANCRSFPSIFRRSMGCRFLAITTAGTYIYRFVCYHPGHGVVAVQPCPSVSFQLHSIYARLCYVSASTRSRSRARADFLRVSFPISVSRRGFATPRRDDRPDHPLWWCGHASSDTVPVCGVFAFFFSPINSNFKTSTEGETGKLLAQELVTVWWWPCLVVAIVKKRTEKEKQMARKAAATKLYVIKNRARSIPGWGSDCKLNT